MIRLHYYPSNASMIPHILLEEMKLPFELVLVDRAQGAHKSASYLKLNPNGLIPVLTDGDLVLYESAAICLHLADTHPQSGMAPALATAQRAHFYKWLMWAANTLHPNIPMYFYSDRYVAPGNVAGAAEFKAVTQQRIIALLQQVDDELARVAARDGSAQWFLGGQYSLLDPYLFVLCRWTRGFADHPARSFAHIGPYLQRMLARPAVQKVLQTEKLPLPYV